MNSPKNPRTALEDILQRKKAGHKAAASAGPAPTEAQEMMVLAEYLNLSGFLWLHVPNEGKRSVVAGRRAKALGLSPGAPDVLIFDQTSHGDPGMAIELKRIKGSRVGDRQQQWIWDLRKRGWVAVICYGSDQAIEAINRWYKGSEHKRHNQMRRIYGED